LGDRGLLNTDIPTWTWIKTGKAKSSIDTKQTD